MAEASFEHRSFKAGISDGTDERTTRRLRSVRNKRQEKLRMRRGAHVAVDTGTVKEVVMRDITPLDQFRDLKTRTIQSICEWISTGTADSGYNTLDLLSQVLHHENEGYALASYPELFGDENGAEVLKRLVVIISCGNSPVFRTAINCVTTILFEPQNIACVKILCESNLHGVALSQLMQFDANDSEVRQELLELLGNTARNNQFARDIVLNTEGFLNALFLNFQDAQCRNDWSLISSIIYVMYALCETYNVGETPPLSIFGPIVPMFIQAVSLINQNIVQQQQLSDLDDQLVLGSISFINAVCKAHGRISQDNTPLMVARFEGVQLLIHDVSITNILFTALRLKNRFTKVAISALSNMSNAGHDACTQLVRVGIIPHVFACLNKLGCEKSTKGTIIRIFSRLARYGGDNILELFNQGVIHYLCLLLQGHYGVQIFEIKKDACWTLSYVTKYGNTDLLRELVVKHDMGVALIEGIKFNVAAGEVEVSTSIVLALSKLIQICPEQMSVQMEERDGIPILSRIFHVAHHESELYKTAEFIKDTYFPEH